METFSDELKKRFGDIPPQGIDKLISAGVIRETGARQFLVRSEYVELIRHDHMTKDAVKILSEKHCVSERTVKSYIYSRENRF
jgi:hypothetical protein